MWRAWRDVSKLDCGVWDHERKNSHKLKGLCRVLGHVNVGALTIKFPSRHMSYEFHVSAHVFRLRACISLVEWKLEIIGVLPSIVIL